MQGNEFGACGNEEQELEESARLHMILDGHDAVPASVALKQRIRQQQAALQDLGRLKAGDDEDDDESGSQYSLRAHLHRHRFSTDSESGISSKLS